MRWRITEKLGPARRVPFVAILTAMALIMPSGVVAQDDSYQFTAPVFDIDAAPDGSILVAEGATIKEIRRGKVGVVAEVPIGEPSRCAFELIGCINGLETVGRGNFFATSGGLEGAVGAGLWRVSRGGARPVADIAAFEIAQDPDASIWKDPICEVETGFVGPESNPYHLEALSGSKVLIGDAAGNTLLSAKTNGNVDWVAVFSLPWPTAPARSIPRTGFRYSRPPTALSVTCSPFQPRSRSGPMVPTTLAN